MRTRPTGEAASEPDVASPASGRRGVKRVPLLINGRAGQGRAGRVTRSAIENLLAELGYQVEITTSESRSQGVAWGRAVAGRYELALVAGGDGTMNSVLEGLCGSDTALGLIPLGTGNCLARELGLPRVIRRSVLVAARGRPQPIDVGVMNGRPFAVMAGVGFDARVVASMGASIKNLLGPWAYVAKGLALLGRYRPGQFRVVADGDELAFPGWLVVVGNTATYVYRWRLAENARIDDGLLDVCLFGASKPAQMLAGISYALTGLGGRQVLYRRAARVEVDSDPPVHVQVDGEPAGMTPARVEVLPGALKVMVPGGD